MMEKYYIQTLINVLLDGNSEMAVSVSRRLTAEGMHTEDIVVQGIEVAMAALDSKCTLENFNLLEIMLVGRAVMEVMNDLYANSAYVPVFKETVVIASLEGDVHDIGKNILKIVLTSSGYRVVDCGKNCPIAKLIETIEIEKPIAAGISGLITTVIPLVANVKVLLKEKGLGSIKVIAGGAVLKQSTPGRLNVDFVAETAFDSLHYIDKIAGRIEDE